MVNYIDFYCKHWATLTPDLENVWTIPTHCWLKQSIVLGIRVKISLTKLDPTPKALLASDIPSNIDCSPILAKHPTFGKKPKIGFSKHLIAPVTSEVIEPAMCVINSTTFPTGEPAWAKALTGHCNSFPSGSVILTGDWPFLFAQSCKFEIFLLASESCWAVVFNKPFIPEDTFSETPSITPSTTLVIVEIIGLRTAFPTPLALAFFTALLAASLNPLVALSIASWKFLAT